MMKYVLNPGCQQDPVVFKQRGKAIAALLKRLESDSFARLYQIPTKGICKLYWKGHNNFYYVSRDQVALKVLNEVDK